MISAVCRNVEAAALLCRAFLTTLVRGFVLLERSPFVAFFFFPAICVLPLLALRSRFPFGANRFEAGFLVGLREDVEGFDFTGSSWQFFLPETALEEHGADNLAHVLDRRAAS